MASPDSNRCPICKNSVRSDALTCDACGYSLLTVCAGCHTPVHMQYSYCPHCSRPLNTDQALPTYNELQTIVEKNRTQLIEYAHDLTRLYVKQRQLEQYLPTGLLDKVLLSDSQVVGERRYVTVLFADVVGFTSLSARLDPEDVFLLMNSCFRLLVEQVYKFGGSVDKFIGDALMALFGAPISYGNDAERAVRAAVGMQAAMADFNRQMLPKLGDPLELRAGISTGDAIAGTVGVEGQWSYTVMGSTVNMASRLQSAARVGGILVNQEVYRQTKDLIEYRVLPPIPLKGVGDAVPVFEVAGELAETPTFQQLPVGRLSQLVGRQAELDRLSRIVGPDGDIRGGVVFITGEAGLGKTRLMWEWQCRFPNGVQVWSGYSQNLSQTGYEVWQQIILKGLHLNKAAHQTAASVLLDYLGDETWLPFLETLLFGEMLDHGALASLEPEQLKEQIFVAVNRLLKQAVRRGPLVIMLDNLQWIDRLSSELLQSTFALTASQPIVFCIGSRPDARDLPPLLSLASDLLADRATHIQLPPLSAPDSLLLLGQTLPLDPMPPRLQTYILERAQNIPYYLEELASFIINSEVVEKEDGRWRVTDPQALNTLSLPGTLRGLVRARLDRLPEMEQQLLSYGAVIGPTFSAAVLLAVLKETPHLAGGSSHLSNLVQRGILTFDGASYHFVHNSLYETAYQSLLSERRRHMHRQVGEAIEARQGAGLPADVDQLAHHFTAAQDAPRAIPYLLKAGQKARQRFAVEVALEQFSTALSLLPQAPDLAGQEAAIHREMGDLHQHKGDYDQALTHYQRALELATDANQRADCSRLIGQAWQWKGDTARAQKWFEQALTKISQSRTQITDLIRGRVYAGMGLLYMHKGDYVRAERWSLDAVAVLEQTGQLSDLAKPLNTLGGAYYFQNQWAEASTYVERALNIRRQIGDRLGVAGSLSNLGILYTVGCQWERAIDVFNQSIAMCKEIGALEVTLSNALNNVAYLYIHQGKLDVAEQHLQESLTIKQTAGTTLDVPETLNNLALSRLMQGRLKEADDFISQSIGLCQQTNNNDSLSEAYWYRAKIKLAAGEIEAAHDVCRQAILLANQVMSKVNEGGALRVLAKIQLQQQQYRQAKQTAAISRRILTQINLDYEVARTQLVLAEIAKLTGDEAEFRAAVEAAMPVFERLGAAPALNTLKSLQNRPAEAG